MITNKVNEILQEPMQTDPTFLQHCRLSHPTKSSSVHRWMDDLSFSYCAVKKSYMINIHEREDVRKDRKNHTAKHFKDELQEAVFVKLKKKDLIKSLSDANYSTSKQKFTCRKGYFCPKKEVLEFHVDDAKVFLDIVQKWLLKGARSIRRSPVLRVCIIVGQDESVYLPHSLKNRHWAFDGHMPQRDKTDGLGVMVSLLC